VPDCQCDLVVKAMDFTCRPSFDSHRNVWVAGCSRMGIRPKSFLCLRKVSSYCSMPHDCWLQ